MNVRILILLITPLVVNGTACQQAKSDLEKLKGTWVMVEDDFGGWEKGSKFAFRDTELTCTVKDKKKEIEVHATYKLDPSKNPKEIDVVFGEKVLRKGIYLLEGDSLQLCFVETGQRPTEFKKPDKGALYVLKRQKP